MTIQELLEKSGGVIEWVERHPAGEGEIHEYECRVLLAGGGVCSYPGERWIDTEILNAILAAHSRASGFDEMLAALEASVGFYNYCLEYMSWSLFPNLKAEVELKLAEAEEAIKKAKGESQ